MQQEQEAAAQAEALRNEAKEVEESASKYAAGAKERLKELVQASGNPPAGHISLRRLFATVAVDSRLAELRLYA